MDDRTLSVLRGFMVMIGAPAIVVEALDLADEVNTPEELWGKLSKLMASNPVVSGEKKK